MEVGVIRYAVLLLSLIAVLVGCQQTPPAYESSYTAPPSTALAPVIDGNFVTIIGDGFTASSVLGGRGDNGWPAHVARWLKQQNVDYRPKVAAERGAGYVRKGAQSENTFADKIPGAVGLNTRLVVFFGSVTDRVKAPDQVSAAARETFALARTTAPNAKLLVIGPAWVLPDPPPELLRTRDVVRAEAEAAGAIFVDPLAEAWFVDRPGLASGIGGEQPNDDGHIYMAEKITPLMAQLLQPPPP